MNEHKSLVDVWTVVWKHKWSFLMSFFLIFTLTYGVLFAVDFLPEPPAAEKVVQDEDIVEPVKPADTATNTAADAGTDQDNQETAALEAVDESEEIVIATNVATAPTAPEAPESPETAYELPRSMYIPSLERRVDVLNPTSRVIADLDAALLEGVVRHPDAARLGQDGNVFILGHSSYLPTVLNRNFKAFNGIQNLAWGDAIEVTGDDFVYVYRVDTVYRARAQDVTVPIAGTGPRLTLATCNSFGSIDDRYIVEADLIAQRPV